MIFIKRVRKNKKLSKNIIIVILFIASCVLLGMNFSIQVKSNNLTKQLQSERANLKELTLKYDETVSTYEAKLEECKKEEYLGEFTSTAYCVEKYFHACNDGSPSSTADGTSPIPYQTVAVDPTVIPLGTNLKIETQNGEIYYVKANDTGGSIKGRKIDMVVDTHHNGILWGVRHIKVWKIKE